MIMKFDRLALMRIKHRSHFGSRYKFGCCGNAGLFFAVNFWSLPAPSEHFLVFSAGDGRGLSSEGAEYAFLIVVLAKCGADGTSSRIQS